MVDRFKNKLTNWRRKSLTIGGKVVLINSVLSSLPLYFFSIYKAPKAVLKTLKRLQREFLWGGNLERRKTAWV